MGFKRMPRKDVKNCNNKVNTIAKDHIFVLSFLTNIILSRKLHRLVNTVFVYWHIKKRLS